MPTARRHANIMCDHIDANVLVSEAVEANVGARAEARAGSDSGSETVVAAIVSVMASVRSRLRFLCCLLSASTIVESACTLVCALGAAALIDSASNCNNVRSNDEWKCLIDFV